MGGVFPFWEECTTKRRKLMCDGMNVIADTWILPMYPRYDSGPFVVAPEEQESLPLGYKHYD